jgi:DNA polymerase-4
MFLTLSMQGFQALVHQVHEPGLRGRPVVAAVSTADQAPLLAASAEARAVGVRERMRLAEAKRICPGVIVRLPDAERARAVQAAVVRCAAAYTPLVASAPGRWDIDLAGSEELWRSLDPDGRIPAPADHALAVALRLRASLLRELALDPLIGIGAHPLAAFLAARLGDSPHAVTGVVRILPEDEARRFDPLPIHWLPTTASLLDHLVFMHVLTIGDLRRLGCEALATIGGAAGRALHALVHDADPSLPASLDAEPSLSAATGTGVGGAGPAEVLNLLAGIAQELGHTLRGRHLAATRLGLTARWGIGTTRHVALAPGYQVRADRDLIHLGERLLVLAGEGDRPWTWLRLTASGLCAGEEQHTLFAIDRSSYAQEAPHRRAAETAPLASDAEYH